MDERERMKKRLNLKLLEAYFSYLEDFFMAEGAFRKLTVRMEDGMQLQIPWFCLASYTPLMVEDIQWVKSGPAGTECPLD